jgi:hypothetical protein
MAFGFRAGSSTARHGVCILACWLVFASHPVAIAGPLVEIKSHSMLQLDSVRRTGDSVVVTGRLFDPSTGLPLPANSVEVRIGTGLGAIGSSAATDADGRFVVELAAEPGQQQVELSFAGNASLDETKVSELADPSLEPVTLTLQAHPTPTGLELQVAASTTGEGALSLPIKVWADRADRDTMAELTTTTTGTAIPIARKQLGGAGTRRFRADFAGDPTHQAATVSGTYELTSASKTSLVVRHAAVAFEDTLAATGVVADEDGIGLPSTPVTLVAGDRRLGETVTGAKGEYRFRVEGEILGAGQLALQAVAQPGGSIQSSRSELVVVRVAPPQPVPVTYTVIAFLATGLAAGAFFAARGKPWRRFAKTTPPAQQAPTNTEAQQGGLVAARPGIVSTLRRASDLGFSGAVRDTVRGRPVPGASVRLRRPGATPAGDLTMRMRPAPSFEEAAPTIVSDTSAERHMLTGEDGVFAIEDLSPGDWVVEVSATSHITETFPLAIPHRGELRGVRVDLVPVREKVFLLYQRAAMPVLPDPKLWGVWSPRQVVDHVRASRPSPALATLTDFIEEVYFSARPIEETVLPTARQRVDAAIAERAG